MDCPKCKNKMLLGYLVFYRTRGGYIAWQERKSKWHKLIEDIYDEVTEQRAALFRF
jgi:hypothetical protein